MKEKSFICDHYVCSNIQSEFIYIAHTDVKAFALSKRFLLHDVFPKYPDIASEIKKNSYIRYKKNIRERLLRHREQHLLELNKKNIYKVINV